MSNSERKGNLAKTTTGNPQWQPPGHSEQQLVPSTSSERVPRSSAEIQSMAFACTLINTNDQCSKQIAGQSPPSGFSTSNQCSSVEIQSNTAPTLKSNHNEHSTQSPGQSQPSMLSAHSNNPTTRGTVEDQANSNITQIKGFEFINCLTGPTTALKHYPQDFPRKKPKWPGMYQHGSFPNESSGNLDDPLDATGSSGKTNTELQSTVDHGGSHSPGIDTEESKVEKPLRSSKEIDDVLQGAKHSPDMQEQYGNKQIPDAKGLETKQSEYPTSSNLASVKSSEEGKQNNLKLEKEPNEFQVTYAKITEKTTLSTAWNQDRPMPVAQQDIGTQTPNNNGEKKDETRLSVDAKNEDKTKIAHSSVPTKRNSSICNLYFDKTTDSRKTLGCPGGIKSSDVSQNNLRHDVDSVLDDGKDSPMKLSDPCKADTDFDFNLNGIPSCFYRKAEKSKNPETYIKKVSITVQGVIAKLYKSTKQAEELLKNAQNLQCASVNLQQLLDDHKNLKEKILPDIENEIKKWNHPSYNEKLDKFISYLQSIEVCLQTWSKKIEDDLKLKNAEATQLRSKSISIIEPLQELYGLKAQTEELKQQLLVTPKLQCTKRNFKWITKDLEIASQNIAENINLLENLEKKYAEAKFVFDVDLEKVKACEIESLLSQLGTAKNALTSTTWPYYLRYKEETRKKYQDILGVLHSTEINLQRKHKQFVAKQEFENLIALTANLKNQATNCKGSGLENAALLKTIESTLPKFCMFNVNHAYLIPEKDRESIKKTIREHEDELKKVQKILAANEKFVKSYLQTSTLLEEIDNFCGPSYEIESLFQKINEVFKYYSDFQFMGNENLKNKLVDVKKRINTAHNNLKSRQPIIEAQERLVTIQEQAEKLQEKVSDFKGDMSSLRNYMKEVEKLQSDLNAFNTMDNEKLKRKAESVSQTIRRTLLHLESIELQFENEMAESMAVEEYTEKQAHHLEESPNMKRICNIAMQLMSIYRQLSDSGINVMDSNQLRWLNMRIGDLEDMLVNGIKPKTAQEEKAFDNAKKLCFQIQQMIANNKQCEEISPELNDIRATGMKALEYHTKIFKGDIRNNQIRWLETQLIECQTKLDRLELPEGVARESRKDVLNLCNQALSALKKHSWCKD